MLDVLHTQHPLLKSLADLLASPNPRPHDIAMATGDLIEAVCKMHARPLPGGMVRTSVRSWNRQICLEVAMGAFGENDHRAELLDALHSAERTVWDAEKLEALAEQIENSADSYAAELRGEADTLRQRD